ncbi:MAG: hypothetical protein H6Q89_5573, partial [Myxococcaceae bacterium]|nr:hypothetical protein [Myxococcaceae bacterium]
MFRSILLAVSCALAGCSSGGTGGTDAGLGFSDFCGRLTEATGAQISTCSSGPKELWSKWFAEDFRCADLARAVDAGRAGYDPAFAQPCLTATASQSCSAFFADDPVPDCSQALSGKVAIGAPCYGAVDCGEGRYCARASNACSGSCKAEIAAGVACASADRCVHGYSCKNSVCTLKTPDGTADVGASCAGSIQCKPDLRCDWITSNCARLIKEGQPCVFGSGICENFTSCSSTTGTCVRDSTAGGPCGMNRASDGGTDAEFSYCLDS